jgi:hypothetical protein
MAKDEQLEIIGEDGVHRWNAWRAENSGVSIDLSRANSIQVESRGIPKCLDM